MKCHLWNRAILALLGLAPLIALASEPTAPAKDAEEVEQLLQHDLEGDSLHQALMITVAYRPGGASLPHRHDAQVFVYVLEGEMTMQVDGKPPVTLRAGQAFYEGRKDIHRISANASATAPAKLLVFMIKEKSRSATRGVPDKLTTP